MVRIERLDTVEEVSEPLSSSDIGVQESLPMDQTSAYLANNASENSDFQAESLPNDCVGYGISNF